MSDFTTQHRGVRADYDRYLAGMDASMRQKVALTAAHLLARGRVADMGMGSGAGSHALAALYPELDVVGVDLDPTMVALARERFRLPNLGFEVGDISQLVFGRGSLDAILDSSVLHHVTSFGAYEHEAAARALAAQVEQLAANGVLVVRDFLDPGATRVRLDLPADDGDDSDDPKVCSTAALFERFAKEFRSLADAPGFAFGKSSTGALPLPPGWKRYDLTLKLAVEFLLRKDYRNDWVAEVKEEYTYFTQRRFEELFGELGLRVLVSTPLRNPWILRNRFRGRYALWDEAGVPVDFPATNYVVVGEKVGPNDGVRFVDAGEHPPLGFLEMSHYEHRTTGRVMDLVRRPNASVDVLPWFRSGAEIFVVVRGGHPRPVLASERPGTPAIDGSRAPHYVTEPLTVIQGDKPIGQTAEELLEGVGISSDEIIGVAPGVTYYPSPGGLQEEVRSMLFAVAPVARRMPEGQRTRGTVRSIEAQQLLRAAQVGGLPDARLELNVYELFARLGASPGPWIADVGEECQMASPLAVAPLESLRQRPPRRLFSKASSDRSRGFLSMTCRLFRELDSKGNVVGETALEFVVPRPLSSNTATVALLARKDDQILLGVDDDDLPAAQCFNGNSALLVTPAWRLPHAIGSPTPMKEWIRARLAAEYGLEVAELWELGGRYHPTAGATPEVVHPLAAWTSAKSGSGRELHWVPLAELVHGPGELLVDGHLRIAALRAAHALGLLGSGP